MSGVISFGSSYKAKTESTPWKSRPKRRPEKGWNKNTDLEFNAKSSRWLGKYLAKASDLLIQQILEYTILRDFAFEISFTLKRTSSDCEEVGGKKRNDFIFKKLTFDFF